MSRRLLEPADVGLALALMAVGAGVRFAWFSGYGLNDDGIFRDFITFIIGNSHVPPDNLSYRFTWWLPTVLACRLLGPTELALILPITATCTLGIGLVYAFGKALFGRTGAIVAAVLLVVLPLDFAWSTMLTNDVMLSLAAGACLLCVRRALDADEPVAKRRLWRGAAVALWLAYHAKVSAILLVPAIALVAWRRRDGLDRTALGFVALAAGLLTVSHGLFYAITGRLDWPYWAELKFQGLTGPTAPSHRLTSHLFWTYPRLLFLPDPLGDLLFSIDPHALVVLALAAPLLGLGTAIEPLAWLLLLFLGMQLNVQRAEGVWIAGFRNIRHLHVVVYPLVLLLAGYLVALRGRRPWLFAGVLGVLVAAGAWQSVSTATKTVVAFDDRRRVCRFLATLPPDAVYGDFQIGDWCQVLDLDLKGWRFPDVEQIDRQVRRAQLAAVHAGYLVTGGSREPYYGCNNDCIPSVADIDAGRWTLLREFPDPLGGPARWRPEPVVRVWRARGGDAAGPSAPAPTQGGGRP